MMGSKALRASAQQLATAGSPDFRDGASGSATPQSPRTPAAAASVLFAHASSLQDEEAAAPGGKGKPAGKATSGKAAQKRAGARAAGRPAKKSCGDRGRSAGDDDASDDDLYGYGAAHAAAPERKGPVSHSTVEKQRRDRINMLIDLLAEEVPPLSNKHGPSQSAGMRRPKHAVLSDTLSLLAKIRQTLKAYEDQIAQLTAGGAGAGAGAGTGVCHAGGAPLARRPSIGTSEASAAAPGLPAMESSVPQPRVAAAAVTAMAPAVKEEEGEQEAGALDEAAGEVDLAAMCAEALNPEGGALTLNPDVLVVEAPPGSGHFQVDVRCLHKPDLYADVAAGLRGLPVCIDHCAFSAPCAGALPDSGSDGLAHGSLQLSAMPGSTVTAEQLHLALYMSVCWSCAPLPAFGDDGGLTLHEPGMHACPVEAYGLSGGLPVHGSPSCDSIDSMEHTLDNAWYC